LRLTGEDPGYFARYKVEEVRRLWTATRRIEPAAILDFGSGIGASLPYLAKLFPTAALTALDVSERSLAISKARFPDMATRILYDGQGDLPVETAAYDLIFTACVFHHIDVQQQADLLKRLRTRLAPGGAFVIFEHNPINPVTRYIVTSCPFDENAVLISASTLKARLRAADFSHVDVRFTGFFPHALAALRPLEPWLSKIPLGAQYYAVAYER
jgi:SAM-dependent methyltransferase